MGDELHLLGALAKSTGNRVILWAAAEIARLREERRWIPVGERLPEEGQEVLCASSIGNIYAQSVVVFHKDDLGVAVWEDDDGFIYRPTHWMPLPTPPKGGEVADE